MNYIRCNKCYQPLKSTNPPFSLTQCGHVFCNKCIGNEKKCFECKMNDIEFLPLTQPLSDRISSLFMPVSDLFEQSLFAYKFQNTQMMISMRRLEEIEKKYNAIKMAYWELKKYSADVTKAYKILQNNQIQCETMQKVTSSRPTQDHINIPRRYFTAANYKPNNGQQNHSRPNQLMRSQVPKGQANVRFNTKISSAHEGYQTDDSMNSIPNSHIRSSIETPPITPNFGVFRIPHMRNSSHSTHMSSNATGTSTNSNSSTPMARNQRY